MDMSSEFDRLDFLEHARRTAVATYNENPLDAENFTRWGDVLLELSQFQNGPDPKQMVVDAMTKFAAALDINPRKHDALWGLGNAYTSNAFLIPDLDEARVYFDKAAQCFEQAFELEPTNNLYKKSLEVASKAPELHAEIHRHGLAQQAMGPGPSASTATKYFFSSRVQRRTKVAISNTMFLDGSSLRLALLHGWDSQNRTFPHLLRDKLWNSVSLSNNQFSVPNLFLFRFVEALLEIFWSSRSLEC